MKGCVEICIELIDYPLMHTFSDASNVVPLWRMVYGNTVPAVGMRMPNNISSEQIEGLLFRVQHLGVLAGGSPWLSRTGGQRKHEIVLARAMAEKRDGVF